jgi:hypothetical protein
MMSISRRDPGLCRGGIGVVWGESDRTTVQRKHEGRGAATTEGLRRCGGGKKSIFLVFFFPIPHFLGEDKVAS